MIVKYYIKDKTEGNKVGEDVTLMPLKTIASIGKDIELHTPGGGRYKPQSIDLSRWSEISQSEYMDLYASRNIAA